MYGQLNGPKGTEYPHQDGAASQGWKYIDTMVAMVALMMAEEGPPEELRSSDLAAGCRKKRAAIGRTFST